MTRTWFGVNVPQFRKCGYISKADSAGPGAVIADETSPDSYPSGNHRTSCEKML